MAHTLRRSIRPLGWRMLSMTLALGWALAGCGGGSDPLEAHGEQALGAGTAFGINLLIDPSFEGQVDLGDLPTAPARWRGDLCDAVAAENGIAPRSGAAMLKFQATGAAPSFSRLTSRQWQLVELGPFADAVAAGGVRVKATAWFNRAAGDSSSDRRFDLRVLAFDGKAAELPVRYAANAWLAEDTAPLVSTPAAWQRVEAGVLLPPATTYVLVEIYASEDVFNDGDEPEFSGHYADDVSLVLLRPNTND